MGNEISKIFRQKAPDPITPSWITLTFCKINWLGALELIDWKGKMVSERQHVWVCVCVWVVCERERERERERQRSEVWEVCAWVRVVFDMERWVLGKSHREGENRVDWYRVNIRERVCGWVRYTDWERERESNRKKWLISSFRLDFFCWKKLYISEVRSIKMLLAVAIKLKWKTRMLFFCWLVSKPTFLWRYCCHSPLA